MAYSQRPATRTLTHSELVAIGKLPNHIRVEQFRKLSGQQRINSNEVDYFLEHCEKHGVDPALIGLAEGNTQQVWIENNG